MEGSESEAVFEACNLNPQLFINEILNSVDDVVDGAFDFYLQEASAIAGADRTEELGRGVSFLRNLTQGVLDERLLMWEKYCLRQCFTIPEGFVLPKAQDSSSNSLLPDEDLCDQELDSQLDSLRKKLVAVGQESTELQNEILTLQKQSAITSHFDASVIEALQLYQNSGHEMYQEIGKSAAELQLKMEDTTFKSMNEEVGLAKVLNVCNSRTQDLVGPGQGLSASLEDIQGSLNHIRSV